MGQPFEVHVDADGFPSRVTVSGDLDLDGGDVLEGAVAPLLSPGSRVEIDLRQVDFLDSSGLAALVSLSQLAEEAPAYLVLLEPSARVRHVMEITSTESLFSFAA
ncbi:MAG: STAS domain-containing protein [Acidimicrobiales bacterium]|nr:STAS domain-containing protein [Acidimicrobiales bacterium]